MVMCAREPEDRAVMILPALWGLSVSIDGSKVVNRV